MPKPLYCRSWSRHQPCSKGGVEFDTAASHWVICLILDRVRVIRTECGLRNAQPASNSSRTGGVTCISETIISVSVFVVRFAGRGPRLRLIVQVLARFKHASHLRHRESRHQRDRKLDPVVLMEVQLRQEIAQRDAQKHPGRKRKRVRQGRGGVQIAAANAHVK